MAKRTDEGYYIESKRFREEALRIADTLKNCPMHFVITNVITMEVEITKSDIDQKTFDAEIQNLRK